MSGFHCTFLLHIHRPVLLHVLVLLPATAQSVFCCYMFRLRSVAIIREPVLNRYEQRVVCQRMVLYTLALYTTIRLYELPVKLLILNYIYGIYIKSTNYAFSLLLTASVSRHMFRRLMSPSSGG
jgi:hypothetical protein